MNKRTIFCHRRRRLRRATFAAAARPTSSAPGANACKGQSACKSASNACKGQNACKGKGFVETGSSFECSVIKSK